MKTTLTKRSVYILGLIFFIGAAFTTREEVQGIVTEQAGFELYVFSIPLAPYDVVATVSQELNRPVNLEKQLERLTAAAECNGPIDGIVTRDGKNASGIRFHTKESQRIGMVPEFFGKQLFIMSKPKTKYTEVARTHVGKVMLKESRTMLQLSKVWVEMAKAMEKQKGRIDGILLEKNTLIFIRY